MKGWGALSPGPGLAAETRDEDVLVQRAKTDARAFAALYDRYRGPIYRYLYRHLGRNEDAEDATSEVFAKVLAGLHLYHDESFRAWLFTIARHVLADLHRRRRIHPPADDIDSPADPDPTPEDAALCEEQEHLLRGLLNERSSDEHRALVLRASGFSTAKVAVVLGRSPAGVRVLMFRALARLRHHVTNRNADSEVSSL